MLDIVKTHEQVHQSRFTRAGATHQTYFFTGFDLQVEIFYHATGFAIVKTHLFEGNFALRDGKLGGIFFILHAGRTR
ncbi:hypothetical protein ACNPKB_16065 [Shewanella marisflavi]|uniref:hypothetical protein n=1 Tax=Shewanella marisflavi TaxID=260364 RepID=UPI003AB01983